MNGVVGDESRTASKNKKSSMAHQKLPVQKRLCMPYFSLLRD